MPKHLLTLRLEDCASSHLKLTASPMFAQLRGVMLHLAFVPANLEDFLNSNLCYTAAPIGGIGGRETCLQHITQALQLEQRVLPAAAN